jgi:membrane protein DedA with SNARE-associated domain
MVARGEIGFLPAAAACFVGIFVGDLLLYAAGRSGSTLTRRLIAQDRIERASAWLRARGPIVVLLSRFTPGLRLPTYLAAGFLRLSFAEFAVYLALAAAAWTPLLVGLAAVFGDKLLQTTPAGGALLAVFVAVRFARALGNFQERRRLIGFLKRKVRWEFWPAWAAYLPLIPYLAYLAIKHRSIALFTAANPGIFSGGLAGESKFQILSHLDAIEGAVPAFELISGAKTKEARIAQAERWPIPFVLKPNVGERGRDVAIVRSPDEIRRYFDGHAGDTIVQEYVPGLEVGIFYIRHPEDAAGCIVSITEKVSPTVTGDGSSTLAELILADSRAVCLADAYLEAKRESADRTPSAGEVVQLVEIGSHCRGSVFLDGGRLKTPELEAAVDRLAKAHPGFYLGRFDVRTSSLDDLRAGRGFKVIELNGVASEPTHIYDPAVSLTAAYRALFSQWRNAFEIGAWNRTRGYRPMPLRDLILLATGRPVTLPQRRPDNGDLVAVQKEHAQRA